MSAHLLLRGVSLMRVRRAIWAAVVSSTAVVLVGCSNPGEPDDPCVLTVAAATSSVTIEVFETASLLATGTESPECGTVKRLWSSTDPLVAAVSSQGVVTGIAVGAATVRATDRDETDGTTAFADVQVTVVAPVAVSITGAPSAIDVGASQQLAATVSGGVSQAVSWTSSAPSVVSVTAGGLATAMGTGTATLTATSTASPNKSASISVSVSVQVGVSPGPVSLAIGGTQQFTAVVSGAVNKAVVWTSSNPSVMSVSTNGLGTALANGSANVIATSVAAPNRTGSTTVTVTGPAPVASIQPFTIPATEAGTARQVTVVPLDAGSNPLVNRTCTWQSSSAPVVTVTSPGMTTTLTVVSSLADITDVLVTVTCEGISLGVTVNVFPIPVASVTVTHDSTFLAVGEDGLARVVLRGAQNQVLSGRAVRWSVSNMARATVPPGSGWTSCAVEGGTCAFAGTKMVRYGANNTFAYGEFSGGTACSNAVFGDPVPNVAKACAVADLATTTSGTGGLDVTGVGAGAVTLTATPVVNPGSVSGNVSVMIVTPFTVTAATSPAVTHHSIETTNVLTFSNPINLSTFTIGNVYLQVSGGAVVPPQVVGQPSPNAYRYYVLHNEATDYVFAYTNGLKDIYGKRLRNPGQIAYTTVEMDPLYFYRISSQWLQSVGHSLSVDPVTFKCQASPTNTNDTKQRWYTNPDPNLPTHWQLQNQFYGATRSLEADVGPTSANPCHMDASGNFTGQYWYTAPYPQAGPGYFRLHSELDNLTKALDQNGGPPYEPFMAPVGVFSGQAIFFQRIARRP